MATIKVYGTIGVDVTAKMVSDVLDVIDPQDNDITVKINSPGGYVSEGWAIHDLLKNSGKNIKTVGEGMVYSIATVIFLAGDTREMYENATGLIHNPFTSPWGDFTSADLSAMAEDLANEEARILDYYVKVTGKDSALLAEHMKNEKILSSSEMVELGFATKVLSPVKALAYYKPKKENKMDEKILEKLDNLANKFTALFGGKTKDMVLKTDDGKEVVLEKEEGSPAVGDKATPDGTFTLESGTKIVVTGGEITSVEEAGAGGDDEMAALKAENEDLRKKVEALEAKALETESVKAEAETLIKDLRAIKNSYKPEGRQQQGKQDAHRPLTKDEIKDSINAVKDKLKK